MTPRRRARFEMQYTITVTYDGGRVSDLVAYSYSDVESKTRDMLTNPWVVSIEVRRHESFHVRSLVPTDRG